jgi:hypothetical protein
MFTPRLDKARRPAISVITIAMSTRAIGKKVARREAGACSASSSDGLNGSIRGVWPMERAAQ